MDQLTSRRRFLALAGTGSALSVAGCGALQSDGTEEGEDQRTATAGGGEGEPTTVTVGVQPDQEALSQRQSEIRSRLESGEINRTEARQELQQAREELAAEVTSAFRDRITEESALTIEESLGDLGAFLVSGTPAGLIGLLSFDPVSGLFPVSVFEDARSRAGETR